MRILLDTHVLLWALAEPERLGPARLVIEDTENEVLFSPANIWEIAIKAGLGRSDFVFDPEQILSTALDTGFIELPIRSDAAAQVRKLPHLHRDPFDRLLIAQAMREPIRFYTADPALSLYSELVTVIDTK